MKEVTHIEVPKEWEITNDWDSHRPLLFLVLKNTDGKVVELGSGDGSTELLKNYCNGTIREFRSYENNKEWSEKTGSKYVHSYKEPLMKKIITGEKNFNVLFVDCAPGEIRKNILFDYNSYAEVIVVHDSEDGADYVYGMKDILSTFQYRIDFKPEGMPQTTAVSNFINIENWV